MSIHDAETNILAKFQANIFTNNRENRFQNFKLVFLETEKMEIAQCNTHATKYFCIYKKKLNYYRVSTR